MTMHNPGLTRFSCRLLAGAFAAVGLGLSQCAVAAAEDVLRFDFSASPLERLESGYEKTLAQVPRCSEKPVVDGRVSDPAWRGVPVAATFGPTGARASAVVCFDDEALHIGIRCAVRHGDVPESPGERDGGVLWKHDHVEIWIDPVGDGAVVRQFCLGIGGSFYDGIKRGGGDNATYDPEWRRAVVVGENGWSAEVTVPLAALDLEQWHRTMGFNIGRNAPGVGHLSWLRAYGDTTEGAIVLEGQPEREVPEVKAPQARDAAPERSMGVGALGLALERTEARPGERWIEARLALLPLRLPVAETRLRARLFRLADAAPVAEAEILPERSEGVLLADLRRHGLAQAELSVELFEGAERTGVAKALLRARECPTPVKPGERIRIDIDVPEAAGALERFPVTFGCPFPAGALWDPAGVRLVDGQAREIPCQKEVTGRWAREGSIQWLRFDALVSSEAGCYVEALPSGAGAGPQTPLRLTEQGDTVTVDTGVARYVLGKGASPIHEIWVDDRRVATGAGARGLYVTDQKNRTAAASARDETMLIESRGPVAACVRFEGFYSTDAGDPLARHITRVELFAGQAFAKVTHTVVLCRDTNEVWFRDVGWELVVAPGASPAAWFGVSREEWKKSVSQPLGGRTAAAIMLQDRHYLFKHGTNHFQVASLPAGGETPLPLTEGEECGDWAALSGDRDALLVCCREAARQHPKEFEIRPDRVVLHLFSSRGGEELDFRAPTLVQKWDLKGWYDKTLREAIRADQEEKVSKYTSNAVGWSKTHELLFAPMAPKAVADEAARLAYLHRERVYAHVDPHWLYRTEAMGRIHPRDPKRFPHAEKVIDETFKVWEERVRTWGDYGFVDYFAGPHLEYRGEYARPYRYCPYTYTLRGDFWVIYARSGDRRIRALAEGTNRAYFDNLMCHWDGAGKVRGLFVSAGTADCTSKHSIPFYWEGAPAMNFSSSSNLYQLIWDYHMTGRRRARDLAVAFGEGAKKWWTPAKARRDWRAIMSMRLVTQAYELTWDPELRAIAEGATDVFQDDEGAIGLTKDRPYASTTYKTQVDVAGLLDAWRIIGTRRYYDLAMKISTFWWRHHLGNWPIFYCNPQGRIGNFLYRETGDATCGQVLSVQMRQASTAWHPDTGKVTGALSGAVGGEDACFVFQGIPYSQDVIVRTNADREPAASWVGFENFGYPASVVAYKGDKAALTVDLRGPQQGNDGLVGGVTLRPVAAVSLRGMELSQVAETDGDVARVVVPKDTPGGAYEITPGQRARTFAMARSSAPMVVHAPEYWKPYPVLRPAARWYFRVPKAARDAAIFFEGSARLRDPSGADVNSGAPVSGWAPLSGDKPGLWSFEPVVNKLVRLRNAPPFFAADDPDHYFEPKIPWQRAPAIKEAEPIPADAVYVAGAIDQPDDRGAHLVLRRYFHLEAGPDHASGDGGQFLPFQQGTVEFYYKPTWSTFSLGESAWKHIADMWSTGERWTLIYMKQPGGGSWMRSHLLYGYFMTDGPKGRISSRCYRQTIVEQGQWIHIAWVWGPRFMPDFRTGKQRQAFTQSVFVNGKLGRVYAYKWFGHKPADRQTKFVLGYSSEGVYDELRISDVQRYHEDFTPPSRDRTFKLDEHTRALFHFDGNLTGESWGCTGDLPASVGP